MGLRFFFDRKGRQERKAKSIFVDTLTVKMLHCRYSVPDSTT